MGRLKSQFEEMPLSSAAGGHSFVHLRLHSAYSLSEGAVPVKEVLKLCEKNHMPAVAITDTSNMFGALEFSLAMQSGGVQPIIGCQIAIMRNDGADRSGRRPEPDPVVLLAQDETGYNNLLKLTSHAFLKTDAGEIAQVPMEVLRNYGGGLICLTGGAEGPVGRLLANDQLEAAEDYVQGLAAIFEGRLYMELQRHGLPLEQKTEPGFLNLAYKLDIPLVATNEVFFADRGMYEAHDALLCIAAGKYVGDADRIKRTPEHYFKSQREMVQLFSDLPEAINNTLVIAQRCAIAAPRRLRGGTRLPSSRPRRRKGSRSGSKTRSLRRP